MKFIQLAHTGIRDNFNPLLVLLLTFITLVSVGQYPFNAYLGLHQLKLGQNSIAEISSVIGKNTFLFFQLLPFVLALFVFIVSSKFLLKRGLNSFLSIRKPFDLKRVLLSATLTFLMLACTFAYDYWVLNDVHWQFQGERFFILLFVSLIFISIQAGFEELIFRGFMLQQTGIQTKRGWIAVLVSGVVFGCMHLSNPEINTFGNIILLYYILSGCLLGLLTFLDDGIELALGFHIVNNVFASVVVTNEWQVFQTDALFINTSEPVFHWGMIAALLVQFGLLFWVFHKRYQFKWKTLLERIKVT